MIKTERADEVSSLKSKIQVMLANRDAKREKETLKSYESAKTDFREEAPFKEERQGAGQGLTNQ